MMGVCSAEPVLLAKLRRILLEHGRLVDEWAGDLDSVSRLWAQAGGPRRDLLALGEAQMDMARLVSWVSLAFESADRTTGPALTSSGAGLGGLYEAMRSLLGAEAARVADPERAQAVSRLAGLDPVTGQQRQILSFTRAGEGRVVEVFGDLENATDVAIYVPGMGTGLTSFDGQVASKARSLYLTAVAGPADNDVAVVAWLGYDPPDSLPNLEVLSSSSASRGAAELEDFVDGLALDSSQSLTLIGHSYGTTLIGSAIANGMAPDAVLAMGSPGMLVDDVEDFGAEDTRFFTMEAPGDYVTFSNWFGGDPNDPRSGFERLNSGGSGHSSYLDEGTAGLANAALVVRGQFDQLDRRGLSILESVEAPIDDAREWVSNSRDRAWHRVDELQEQIDVPLVDPLVDRLVDSGQSQLDSGLDLVDGAVEAGEELIEGVVSIGRWAVPG